MTANRRESIVINCDYISGKCANQIVLVVTSLSYANQQARNRGWRVSLGGSYHYCATHRSRS